jgi:hypothetical protein
MMSLKKINIDIIASIIEKVLKSFSLFQDYSLVKEDIQILSSPTKITNYNYSLISKLHYREIYVRISDYYYHQKLTIWIRNISNLDLFEKIDVELYFLGYLNNKSIKQKMIFSVESEKELEKELEKIFQYTIEHMDEKLKKTFKGELWIEMPHDWGDYK